MTFSPKNVLGMLAAALMAGGLTSACSSSSKTDGGSGSSSSGGSSTASCGAANSTCTVTSECCTGLTCSGGACTSPCVQAGSTCTAASACCGTLVCDQTSNTCLPPNDGGMGTDAGCTLSPAFGPCDTAADCAAPNVCQPASDGGGYCGPVKVAPSALCVANGQACSATSGPCCGGNCVNGSCVPRQACGVGGQGCNVAGDCCNRFACIQSSQLPGDGGAPAFTGTCQPTCSGELGPCNTANGNSDCCADQGYVCLLAVQDGGTAGLCDFVTNSSAPPPACGGPCSANPCQVSTPCAVSSSGVDPCAAAGLVCDPQGSVCRNPTEQDPCLQGGPACQPLANSTVTDLQCLPTPSKFGGGSFSCFQPCALADPASGTSDCVDPLMTCISLGAAGAGAECFFNELSACPTPFGPCDSAGVGDGVCVPYNFSNGSAGLCFQATLDGGGPGAACDANSNRQNGGFCDPTSYCTGGICGSNCNAGTKGTPACGQNDAGPAVGCIPIFGQTGDANDFGTCSVDCDFTSPTGGGCATVDGTPEKCVPQILFTGTDTPVGLCVEAPPVSQQVAVGGVCTSVANLIDTCVPGALCLGIPGQTSNCQQLCSKVGSTGAPCPSGQTCTTLQVGSVTPSDVGFCQ